MSWVSSTIALFYIVLTPFVYLIYYAFQLILYLTSPFVSVARGILQVVLLPYRFLAKFQVIHSCDRQFRITLG